MIVLANTPEVTRYIEKRLGIIICEPSQVFGFTASDGRPLCAVVLNGYTGANIDLTVVAEPGGLTRGVLRYLAHHVFNTNGCRRVTVRTKKQNKRAAKMALRFGFVFEAVAKHHFADDDAVVFRMLKENCRFLHG